MQELPPSPIRFPDFYPPRCRDLRIVIAILARVFMLVRGQPVSLAVSARRGACLRTKNESIIVSRFVLAVTKLGVNSSK